MKKTFAFCVFLLLFVINVLSAMAANELPTEIQKSLQHTVITASAHWVEPCKDTWFVLARTQDGNNTLYCFIIENGIWTEHFSTYKAIPQGDSQISLHISDGAWNFKDNQNRDGQYLEGPILIILQQGMESGTVEQMINFQRSDTGVWNLIALKNYPKSANIDITEETITYYAVADKAQLMIVGTVPCCIERDLQYLCLADIPLTFQQAQDFEK